MATEKRFGIHIVLGILLACFAIAKAITYWIQPEELVFSTILKVLAGIAVILFALIRASLKDHLSIKIFIVILIFVVADLLMKFIFPAGGALFALGHLLLVIFFWMKKKPSARALILGGIIAVAGAIFVFFLLRRYFPGGLLLPIGGAVYVILLVAMMVSSIKMPNILTFASFSFLASDALLALDKALVTQPWIHSISTLLFYLSLDCLAEFIFQRSQLC